MNKKIVFINHCLSTDRLRTTIYSVGCILSFVAIILIIYCIRTTTVDGYEVDIYANTPQYVWLLMIVIYMFGSLVLLRTSLSKENYDRKYFRISFIILLFLNSIILLVPRIKYAVLLDRWDSWYNIGRIRDILDVGHINTFQNPYPGLHVLVSILVNMSGISTSKIEDVFMLTNSLLFSLYPIFMYLLGGKLGLNDVQKASVFCFSILFPYISMYETVTPTGFMITAPFGFATFFIPLIMILIFNKNVDRLLIIILIFTVTISHMVTAISMGIGLFSMKAFNSTMKYMKIANPVKFSNVNNYLIYISFLLIIAWLVYLTDMYIYPTRVLYNAIFLGETFMTPYNTIMNKEGIVGVDRVILLLKLLIPSLIVVFLSLIAVRRIIRYRCDSKMSALFVLLGWFVGNAILFSIITVSFSNLEFSSFRILGMEFILTPILAGYTLGIEIRNSLYNRKNFLILISILVVFFAAGLFTKYPSPYTESINWQTTQHEINGVKWFYSFKNEYIGYISGNYQQAILTGYIGYNNTFHRNDFRDFETKLPKHFGYDNFTKYSQEVIHKYVLLTKFDFYLQSRNGELSVDDLDMLEGDRLTNRIYSNGEYQVYSHVHM